MTAITHAVFEFKLATWRKPIEQLDNWREVIELLLGAGAPQDLLTAIAVGRTAAVREILNENPALARSADRWEDLPLNWAVNLDQPEIVEILLAAGAKIDAVGDYMDAPPLHRAARLRRGAIAKILIEHQADINQIDGRGQVPLHQAAYNFKPQLVRLLLEAGAKKDAEDRNGQTPREYAQSGYHARPLTEAEALDRAETIRLLSEP